MILFPAQPTATLSAVVTVRLAPAEKTAVQIEAKTRGLSMSAYCRAALLQMLASDET